MMVDLGRIAIIGGGAFGTALACVSARTSYDTLIYLRDEITARSINEVHLNRSKLPGIDLPADVRATTNIDDITDCNTILFAVPAQQSRNVAEDISPHLGSAKMIIACAKGLEKNTGFFQHQVLAQYFNNQKILALSGPGFASDIARGLPTALAIAANNIADAEAFAAAFSESSLRLYSSDDLAGLEIGGALKNVLAIGVGVVRGLKLGASAEAALVARGFAELRRLGEAMGAKSETLSGLSGLGDLVLTCSSPESRNFSYGMALGRTEPLVGLPLAEGVFTARSAAELARQQEIDAPIISCVAELVDGVITPQQAVDLLLSRPLRSETG